MNAETIDLMRRYLVENGVRYNDSISTMVVRRNRGEVFSFTEHLSALIYALLTNQTKCSCTVKYHKKIMSN